jgi:2-oxoglutarate dehydrogenase E1 component
MELPFSPSWIEDLYQRWCDDPQQVSAEWSAYFSGFDLGLAPATDAGTDHFDAEMAQKTAGVQSLIYRYRDLGHLSACIDPLSPCDAEHPMLRLEAFGLDEGDLDRVFASLRFPTKQARLRDIVALLRDTYCRTLGVEFMHIQNPEERQWLKDRMEACCNRPERSEDEHLAIYKKLLEATRFEAFLHRKFPGQKRFSLEGGEAIIPTLCAVVHRAGASGVNTMVLGMSHRGRLNVLANILRKPLENMFSEFRDNMEFAFVGDGDVKYHKGVSAEVKTISGQSVHLTLANNPSHLEAVDPVVEGKARARQDDLGDTGASTVLPVLIHGDAAFAGQGIVAEVLNLSQLEGYRTGGTLHLILNNQIGFTTLPEDARSTLYATDIAKMLMVPIFHVNGEDPGAAAWAATLAFDYRQQFGKDAVLELICYRKYGHNEGDEPNFTQPLMYERIRQRPNVADLYRDQLLAEGIAAEQLDAIDKEIGDRLDQALERPPVADPGLGYAGKWTNFEREYSASAPQTGVPRKTLLRLGKQLAALPDGFTPHPKVVKLLQERLSALTDDTPLDWGNGETLAYATMLAEGHLVRLSGQDSRRGTFNHRHAVLHDIKTGDAFTPLTTVTAKDARFHVYDSLLSEAAVLGFEYGYSQENPNGLVIWEAQFGDFANGAQVIIDQFISSGISKWDRSSGLTLFLPHGYEGQGAEHSSARIERYLQLCAEYNMFVVTPSTPAQLFHLLRRQVKLPFRRPLIVFTPKSLLRHPMCRSPLAEFTEGKFQPIIIDPLPKKGLKRLILCSGKIYYELLEKRTAEKRPDIALVRIEQLYPLDEGTLEELFAACPDDVELCWVQEEPANGGAWAHLAPQLQRLAGRPLRYIGRPAAAATAVGSHRLHKELQDILLAAACGSLTPP